MTNELVDKQGAKLISRPAGVIKSAMSLKAL
jgi:hypothetical protein